MNRRWLALTSLLPLLSACTPERPPRYARLRDLDASTMASWNPDQPLVVEIDRGETIPLHFAITGPLLETPKDLPPITLRARQHFYLRVSRHGLQSSVDKDHFGDRPVAPGTFQIGFGVTKEGPLANVIIHTPTPRGAAP
jgi:hypothetical protein